jgi:hypothetical protein
MGKWEDSSSRTATTPTPTHGPRPLNHNRQLQTLHDRQPLTRTMTYHAPAVPAQPPPSATTTTEASGESPYPTKGVVDDVAHLPPRKPPPGHATSRNTSSVVHHDGPGHAAPPPWRPRTPPRKKPALHQRRRRRRTLQPARGRGGRSHRRSSARGSARSALHDPDLTVLIVDPSSKMAMTPPAIGSPPSLLIGEEPGGKRCIATLITPTHDVYEALRR